jgi:FlaA1/EpsC-like NDP-sugar epimerase
LHLLDISENNLVEVVRELRSSDAAIPADFRTFCLDFTSVEMTALLRQQQYDYVLNFSALKHVRSERDPFTLMRLLNVNVLGVHKLIQGISTQQQPGQVFSVSSDKAVLPASLMGASKSFMERVLLHHAGNLVCNSARFANVAFSEGSLLRAFAYRVQKRQPLSAPLDVRRYFISPREAAQLCLLGCFCIHNREIVYPKFQANTDLMTFADIARTLLHAWGYKPLECGSAEEARALAAAMPAQPREWPCHFSRSDTSGEKPREAFFHQNEPRDEHRFDKVGVVTAPTCVDSEVVLEALQKLEAFRERQSWSHEDLCRLIAVAVPDMERVFSDKNLDQKM